MEGWITGIGWVTAAGFGLGRDALQQPFQAGQLEIPKRKQIFEKPDMRFGRLDEFSRIGLAAIAFCLRDAEREVWQQKREIGIIAASRYGCLQTDLAYMDTLMLEQGQLASPNLFAYTVANSFLGEAALRFGLNGGSFVLNQGDRTGLAALRIALEDLAWSEQEGVLAGISDLNPPPEFADEDFHPGSLFLLMEKEQQERAYGKLASVADEVFFNSVKVQNLEELIAACLAEKHS